jgi:hypothetical protein
LLWNLLYPPPPPPPSIAYKGKVFTCHAERRKTKIEEREIAIIAVLADRGRGEVSKQGSCYLFLLSWKKIKFVRKIFTHQL